VGGLEAWLILLLTPVVFVVSTYELYSLIHRPENLEHGQKRIDRPGRMIWRQRWPWARNVDIGVLLL
jgi:hypothetical protein